jgi:hypothetical protein
MTNIPHSQITELAGRTLTVNGTTGQGLSYSFDRCRDSIGRVLEGFGVRHQKALEDTVT